MLFDVSVNVEPAMKLLNGLVNPSEQVDILDEATAVILNRIRTRFLSEVDPDGVPWVPSQAAIHRRERGGTGTLFDTGRLFRSIQAAAVGPNERRIYTDVPYAAVHQLGLNGQVKRVFLGFSEDDAEIASRVTTLRVNQLLAHFGT